MRSPVDGPKPASSVQCSPQRAERAASGLQPLARLLDIALPASRGTRVLLLRRLPLSSSSSSAAAAPTSSSYVAASAPASSSFVGVSSHPATEHHPSLPPNPAFSSAAGMVFGMVVHVGLGEHLDAFRGLAAADFCNLVIASACSGQIGK
uniref:Uncharacterized protein n=1 Tax=Oryza brachyantha TaxID=4533 RepID=J3N064_ORYBR